MFGGKTTLDMKRHLGVAENRALADFLPTLTIKAKDFAAELGGSLRLPIFEGQLPFPNVADVITSEWFAPFRRLGQRALYRWYHLKDEVL